MKKRVAGIMRVKNEGPFIRDCIESCIDALDELIVVYNDCTDNSVEEIGKMAQKYPDKIRVYGYPYEVRAYNLSRDEFETLKKGPEDNPHLLSSYCNFALSKVTADYAMKIDADQIYFSNKLKSLLDYVRTCNDENIKFKNSKLLFGRFFRYWISAYLTFSWRTGRILPILPKWILEYAYPAYLYYAKWAFKNEDVCFSLSGINVLETDETLISMAHSHPANENVMPAPFNGVGDTVIFKMGPGVKFRKAVMVEYNQGDSFCIAEEFVHPYKRQTYVGFFWKHIRTMRPSDNARVLEAYKLDPQSYLNIESFKKLSYRKILKHAQKNIFLPANRILFGFIYKANKKDLFNSLEHESLGGAIKKQSKA